MPKWPCSKKKREDDRDIIISARKKTQGLPSLSKIPSSIGSDLYALLQICRPSLHLQHGVQFVGETWLEGREEGKKCGDFSAAENETNLPKMEI